jgi:hypothetical protein
VPQIVGLLDSVTEGDGVTLSDGMALCVLPLLALKFCDKPG